MCLYTSWVQGSLSWILNLGSSSDAALPPEADVKLGVQSTIMLKGDTCFNYESH